MTLLQFLHLSDPVSSSVKDRYNTTYLISCYESEVSQNLSSIWDRTQHLSVL